MRVAWLSSFLKFKFNKIYMQEKTKKELIRMISFFVVFILSILIFYNWNSIEKFVFQLFK